MEPSTLDAFVTVVQAGSFTRAAELLNSQHAQMTGRIIDLVHEGFDLAIRLGDLPDANLAARKLGEIHDGLFAAPESPEALDMHDLIQFSGSRQRRGWPLTRAGKTLTVPVAAQARMKANNSHVVRDVALNGLGFAQLPLLLARPAVAAGQLQPVLPDWVAMTVHVRAVFASARYLTPKVRAFIDLAASAPELRER